MGLLEFLVYLIMAILIVYRVIKVIKSIRFSVRQGKVIKEKREKFY